MVPRGRPINPTRAAAKAAGARFYADDLPCAICGTLEKYVSNSGCRRCAINRGTARYAALDKAARAAIKVRDHERYVKRMSESLE